MVAPSNLIPFSRTGSQFFFGLLTLACFGAGLCASDDNFRVQGALWIQEQFTAAQSKFESAASREDYLEAAGLFEGILSSGFESGAIRFNIGNAYFKANEFGRAILNYRKAKQFRPNDPYLLANLEQALAIAPGRLPEAGRPWWKSVLFWSDWLSPKSKVWVVAIGFSGVGLVLLLAIWLRKSWLLWVQGFLVFVLALVGGDVWIVQQQLEQSSLGVVVAETIARKGTGEDYAPAFDQPLQDGAEFRILSTTSNWTFGRFEGIGDGWIRNEFVAR